MEKLKSYKFIQNLFISSNISLALFFKCLILLLIPPF